MICKEVGCKFFSQEVGTDHRHTLRRPETACQLFNQFVPFDHQHVS